MAMTAYLCRIVCCRRRFASRREDAVDCIMSAVSVVVIPKNFVRTGLMEAELNSWPSSPDDDIPESCMSSTSSWLVSDYICVLTWNVCGGLLGRSSTQCW